MSEFNAASNTFNAQLESPTKSNHEFLHDWKVDSQMYNNTQYDMPIKNNDQYANIKQPDSVNVDQFGVKPSNNHHYRNEN